MAMQVILARGTGWPTGVKIASTYILAILDSFRVKL